MASACCLHELSVAEKAWILMYSSFIKLLHIMIAENSHVHYCTLKDCMECVYDR